MKITIARSDINIRRCIPAMLALRGHLTTNQAFDQIRSIQESDQYVLAFIDEGDEDKSAPAVIGYRVLNFLYSGKTLYIDDLSTLPEAQGKGYASALLDFVIDQSRQLGCQCISLDSGQNPARYDAHRLYLNKRFNIVSHHFKLDLL